MEKAVFFDRDGTLIEEKNYIKDSEEVFLLQTVAETLVELKNRGYLIVVVSNQSGIARGYLSEADFDEVNNKMLELLGNSFLVNKIYHCPHHPKFSGECSCRKPNPGMLFKAADELGINLENSYIVGDKLSDIKLVETAGLKGGFLVKTGYGSQFNVDNYSNVYSVNQISEILEHII